MLKTVPENDFLEAKHFGKPAIKELNAMNFKCPFDSMSDVIRVLDVLVSLGLVTSSYQVVKEIYSTHDRVCGSIIKYKLTTKRNKL